MDEGARAGRTIGITADLQGIVNPGMNADRGPALAPGLRFHAYVQSEARR